MTHLIGQPSTPEAHQSADEARALPAHRWLGALRRPALRRQPPLIQGDTNHDIR